MQWDFLKPTIVTSRSREFLFSHMGPDRTRFFFFLFSTPSPTISILCDLTRSIDSEKKKKILFQIFRVEKTSLKSLDPLDRLYTDVCQFRGAT